MKTKFSIIMLVYNTKEEYLRFALESVFNQDYDNYEVIIIDDGSDKKTKTILNEYSNKSIIKHQENKGMTASRIEGLKLTTGDYVIFVDSDDYIVPDTLSTYSSIINKYNSDIVMHDFVKFSNNIDNILSQNNFFIEGEVNKDEVIKQLCMLHTNGTCGRAVKKELFYGIENNIDAKLVAVGEDVQQSAYVLMKANSFYYTHKMIYYYRIVQEHREYNNIKRINDCNFLVPVYRIVFLNNNDYINLLPIFKTNAINSIVYNSFRICLWVKDKKERNQLLNELNDLEIVKIVLNIKCKCSLTSSLLFHLLTRRKYFILNIISNIYDLLFGMQKI